jgi:hypothetical protein
MEICKISCSIAIVFLIAMFYVMFSVDKTDICREFEDTLSDEQLRHYKNIVKERRTIYFTGFLFGIVLSILYIFYKTFDGDETSFKRVNVLCIVGSITFVTSYLYYILTPKSQLTVVSLNEQKQREMWVKVYRTMQFHYHFGFFLGIISVLALSNSFCE